MANRTPNPEHRDVVVLGAGAAGLLLARHLRRARPDLRITVVDPGPLADRARSKVGESSTESSSWYLQERLGLGEHLADEHVKKMGLRFFLPGETSGTRPEFGLFAPGPRSFGIPFAGLDPVTWQLHRGRLEAFLADELVRDGVEVRPFTRAEIRLGAPHRLAVGTERWTASWVIDASGGGGALPVAPGEDQALGHVAHAAWFWVDRRLDPDGFSSDPAFRARLPADLRWRSTTHLVGEGYWVWLIALGDGSTSVGVVTDPAIHPREAFTTPEGCRGWISTHEPALAGALGDAPWVGYARRGWESHARRTLVSGERWGVTGDTAAFLDPLFSSGLDLLAIGNELLVPRILDDLDGADVARDARRASGLFSRIVEQYLRLYLGSYRVMGHPRAMMAKIGWDLAVYLGFLAPMVRSGRLGEEAFVQRAGFVGQGVASLQERVSAMLVAWAARRCPPVTGVVDQGQCAPLASVVEHLRAAREGDVLPHLHANLGVLEQLAVAIFRRAGEELGLPVPVGPLNPYAIGPDPARWAADGLEGGRRVEVEPWIAAGTEALWL